MSQTRTQRVKYTPYRGLEDVVRVHGVRDALFVRIDDHQLEQLDPRKSVLVDAAINASKAEMHASRFQFRPVYDDVARKLAVASLMLSWRTGSTRPASPAAKATDL